MREVSTNPWSKKETGVPESAFDVVSYSANGGVHDGTLAKKNLQTKKGDPVRGESS